MDARDTMEKLLLALTRLRVHAMPLEYDLHRMIEGALNDAGIAYIHEAVIAPRCRVDFLVDGVGIEVKKGRVPMRALRAQAERYLRSDALTALIVVTTRGARLPAQLCGKPVHVFGLNRLWGVSLP